MATYTKTVSGNTTSYVITDAETNTLTIALTQGFGGGRTCIFTSAGGLHQDGQQLLDTLMQQISTGLTP